MQIRVQVLSEESRNFPLKRGGEGTESSCSCLDLDPQAGMKNTMDYVLNDDERKTVQGKLRGKTLTLGVTDIRVFGGRIKMSGKILGNGEVPELKVESKPEPKATK